MTVWLHWSLNNIVILFNYLFIQSFSLVIILFFLLFFLCYLLLLNPIWGDLKLLYFYPRNWQGSMLRTMHPWLLHMSIWQYWLWFTFIIALSLYFIYVIKSVTYSRADIRGTRAVGDKRRNAWSEMLIVIFPFFWSINIVSNAFCYLRLLEGGGGYAFLTVQVSAYQWGWKYCYNDTTYLKILSSPIRVGYHSSLITKGNTPMFNKHVTEIGDEHKAETSLFSYWIGCMFLFDDVFTLYYQNNWMPNYLIGCELYTEVYFCRWWLKRVGVLENELKNNVQNRLYQSGYWVTAQGTDPNVVTLNVKQNNTVELIADPLRLLRSTGALVLRTRLTIRLMSCSEDITHSWAVPGLGIKMDCVPGRLFCLFTTINREGVYFGQCSELCGWNHYNMPVVVYALPLEHFIIWWELELHAIFQETVSIVNAESVKQNGHFSPITNYGLINVKFK